MKTKQNRIYILLISILCGSVLLLAGSMIVDYFNMSFLSKNRLNIFLFSLFIFGLPAVFYIIKHKISSNIVSLNGLLKVFLGYVFVLVFICYPLYIFNEYLVQFLKPHFSWIQILENRQKEIESLLIKENSSKWDWIANIFIMALSPAIVEELFFRVASIDILKNSKFSIIKIVLISSTIFTVIHLNINGFFYIFALACFLSLVWIKTKNWYYIIFVHFINNLLALILINQNLNIEESKVTSKDLWIAISIIILGVFLLVKYYSNCKNKTSNNE